MLAFKATFTTDGEDAKELLIGGDDISQAARKAKEYCAEQKKYTECVSLELTEEVIL